MSMLVKSISSSVCRNCDTLDQGLGKGEILLPYLDFCHGTFYDASEDMFCGTTDVFLRRDQRVGYFDIGKTVVLQLDALISGETH